MLTKEIKIPKFAKFLLQSDSRYKVLYGGRGSGKSYAVSDSLLVRALEKQCFILCAREYQNSIKDSVYSLLCQRIEAHELNPYYRIYRDEIITTNGSKFIFKGLKHNVQSLKSTAGITHLWVEEADSLSHDSWHTLRPTIRAVGSEIWVTFNPNKEDDVVYTTFVKNTHPSAIVTKVNYNSNPYFPEELEEERVYDQASLDRDLYEHIWLGECHKISDALIFKGKFFVEEFEPTREFGEPVYGFDFGFSQDPTAVVEVYVTERVLYVRREAWKVGLELDQTSEYVISKMPGIELRTIRADSSRPDNISYLKRHGLPLITSVIKGAGSVEDGIAFMRSFEKIVIHPSCVKTIDEFGRYSYKTDGRTKDITHIIVDKYNHTIDSIRYALQPFIKSTKIDYKLIL